MLLHNVGVSRSIATALKYRPNLRSTYVRQLINNLFGDYAQSDK